jgi:hypothetical protein
MTWLFVTVAKGNWKIQGPFHVFIASVFNALIVRQSMVFSFSFFLFPFFFSFVEVIPFFFFSIQGPVKDKCKYCLAQFQIPSSSTRESLPCGAFVANLLKASEKVPGDLNKKIMCEACKQEEATIHCVEDEQNFCDNCAALQGNVKACSGHHLEPLLESFNPNISSKRIPRCETHPLFDMDTFCVTCKKPICAQCSVKFHRGHEICSVDEIAEPLREDIAGFTMDVNIWEKLVKQSINIFEANVLKVDENAKSTEKEVEGFFDTICEAVNARRSEVIREVRKKREEVKEERNQVQELGFELTGFKTFSEALLTIGTPSEIAGSHELVWELFSPLFSFDIYFHFSFILFRSKPERKCWTKKNYQENLNASQR